MVLEYAVICAVAAAASLMTFFSGFGLGTLLLPVFALFFPLPTAVAATAIVHLLNNLFKLGLVRQYVNGAVLLRFGLPALVAAMIGAWLLLRLVDLAPLYRYEWYGLREVTAVGLVVGSLILTFAVKDLLGRKGAGLDPAWLPVGGLLSGFFGGLSGHQGALRSTFLLQCGLGKRGFVATGVAIACLVDLARLAMYIKEPNQVLASVPVSLLTAAVLAAFTGAYVGRMLLEKVTLVFFHRLVAVFLGLAALAMIAGIL